MKDRSSLPPCREARHRGQLEFHAEADPHRAGTGSSSPIHESKGVHEAAIVQQVLRKYIERQMFVPLQFRVEIQHLDAVGLAEVAWTEVAIALYLATLLAVVETYESALITPFEIVLRG